MCLRWLATLQGKASRLGIKTKLCPWLALWPWTRCIISLGFNFLTCKMGIMMMLHFHSWCWGWKQIKELEILIWGIVVVQSEKAMAPHSSTLAWKIPWMEEPGRLQSMGSLGVGHDWATSLSLFTLMHWRRKWQPTPVFLPGESQGRGSLVGCRLWGRTESDTTEATQQQQQQQTDGYLNALT